MTNFAISQPISSATSSNQSLSEILEQYPSKPFKKGSYIFREGHPPKNIYFLDSGKALSLSSYPELGKELSNGYVLENQFINLFALTENLSLTHSAKALTNVTVKAIPLLAFHNLMRHNAVLNQKVLQSIIKYSERITKQNHQMVLLSSNQRIIHFLLNYVADAGSRVGFEWVVRDFFTQHQIALLTNTARQTVSTLLNELRRKRIIHFTKKYLIIRELDVLKKMAEE